MGKPLFPDADCGGKFTHEPAAISLFIGLITPLNKPLKLKNEVNRININITGDEETELVMPIVWRH